MWGLFVGFRALPRRQSIWGVEESSPNLRDRDRRGGHLEWNRPPTDHLGRGLPGPDGAGRGF